jgi:hypothetical protein
LYRRAGAEARRGSPPTYNIENIGLYNGRDRIT